MQKKSTTPRQPKATLINATPQGRTYAYLYRVGSQQVQVVINHEIIASGDDGGAVASEAVN